MLASSSQSSGGGVEPDGAAPSWLVQPMTGVTRDFLTAGDPRGIVAGQIYQSQKEPFAQPPPMSFEGEDQVI